jgi:hypothetical protein
MIEEDLMMQVAAWFWESSLSPPHTKNLCVESNTLTLSVYIYWSTALRLIVRMTTLLPISIHSAIISGSIETKCK